MRPSASRAERCRTCQAWALSSNHGDSDAAERQRVLQPFRCVCLPRFKALGVQVVAVGAVTRRWGWLGLCRIEPYFPCKLGRDLDFAVIPDSARVALPTSSRRIKEELCRSCRLLPWAKRARVPDFSSVCILHSTRYSVGDSSVY